MYMTYKHDAGACPPACQIRLTLNPNDPYTTRSQLGTKPAPPSMHIREHHKVREDSDTYNGEGGYGKQEEFVECHNDDAHVGW